MNNFLRTNSNRRLLIQFTNTRFQLRSLCSNNLGPYFITTPIFYVNAEPHIGHVYTTVLADAAARFHKLLGHSPVIFSTGTDEHGLKIQQAAVSAQQDPQLFCDNISKVFHQTFSECEISCTDFIRTTEPRHKNIVAKYWEDLVERGFIYKGKYEGWYCIPDETFLTEDQTKMVQLSNGTQQRVSVESEHPVEWYSEENYMFKLSAFQKDLQNWLSNDSPIYPAKYGNQLTHLLENKQLEDLSISRPSARLSWGIPVPGDPSQTVYVWLDALLNYLTVSQHSSSKHWPPSVQVIGKDILKFHGVYWPAFLLAAGLKLPPKLLVHGHWLVDDRKMSKSLGNVVQPRWCADRVTPTGLRYFLLHEGVPSNDGNFSYKRMVRIINSELADGLGNLVNRCCGKIVNPAQTRPGFRRSYFDQDRCGLKGLELLSLLEKVPPSVTNDYHHMEFYKGIDAVLGIVREANTFFQLMEPWKLKKEAQDEQLEAAIGITMECARIVGILLQPVVPSFSDRLLTKLGVDGGERSWQFGSLQWTDVDQPLGKENTVLFSKIETK